MTSLTDRYVHATMTAVPDSKRDDLGEELRSTITDMVDARMEAGEPAVAAERSALTELGDPGVLASRYTDVRLQLIGPRWFLTWKRLTLNLLTWVPGLVATLAAVFMVLDGEGTVGEVVVEALFTAASTAIQVVFWTTLVFAILDRVVTDSPGTWTPDLLPLGPGEREYSFNEAAASIVWNLLIAFAIVLQAFNRAPAGPEADRLPVLDPDLWTFWLPFLLVVIAAVIGLEVWKYRRGWSPGVVVAVVVTSVTFSAPVAWLALEDRLLNPDFVQAVGLGTEGLDLLNQAIAVGAILVAVWEIGEAVLKSHRTRRSPSRGGTLAA